MAATYKKAIKWIANECDCGWIEDFTYNNYMNASIEAQLVADLFGKTIKQVGIDLLKELKHQLPNTFHKVEIV